MDAEAEHVHDFLYELYKMTAGDVESQASMQDIGARMGLEKRAAAALAEELIVSELVELKTLAGEIGITEAGLDLLAQCGRISQAWGHGQRLSGEEVLTAEDRIVIDTFLADTRQAIASAGADYPVIEEMVIDVKTIETHLLSARPKTAVVRAVLVSLGACLKTIHQSEIVARYEGLF